MAKITLDLNQFKASGVYTVEFDSSERIVLSTETIRLVVGFSRKGPFNAPVFIRDVKTARTVFGALDTFLEKRGSFFHRSIETCLQTGPVFAINLLPLNNVPLTQGGDGVDYRSFSLDIDQENGPISRDLIASFYNKERFWFADTENFIALANNNPLNKGKLLHLSNLSQKPMSFIIRKAKPAVQGYALTAREWYGAGNVPDYIYEFDYMEDYFIEIIAVEGNWTDYKTLSEDPVFSKYFDKRGIKVDGLNEFLALDETVTIANFIGSIIPDFIDNNGSNQFIEVLVNNAVAATGIFMAVNREELDDYANSINKVDLIGHSLISTTDDTIDFLSYNTPINKAILSDNLDIDPQGNPTPVPAFTETNFAAGPYVAAYIESQVVGGNSGNFHNVIVVPKPPPTGTVFTAAKYQELLDSLTTNSLIESEGLLPGPNYGEDYVKVDSVIDNGTEMKIVVSNPNMASPAYIETPTFVSSTVANIIEVDAIGSLLPGDIILVQAPGYTQYFEVATAVGTSITIVIAPVAVAMAHSPGDYCGGTAELTELQTALAAATIFTTDVTVTAWTVIATNDNMVPNLLTSVVGVAGISTVIEPDTVFVHTVDGLAPATGNEDYLEAYIGAKLAKDIVANRIVDGDLIYYAANAFNYINVDEEWGIAYSATSNLMYGVEGVRIRQYSNAALTLQITGTTNNFVTGQAGFESFVAGGIAQAAPSLLTYSASINDLRISVDIIPSSLNGSATSFRIEEADGAEIEIGYFLVNAAGTHLTRVISKVKRINQSTGAVEYEIGTTISIQVTAGPPDTVTVFTPLNTYADRLQFTNLSGFVLTDYHLPKTQSQLEKIYGVIENTNLGVTLASKDIIEYRYIIDTMKFGIAAQMGPKSILSRLAKNRQKCMAILNAPSIKEFMASTDPRFTDDPSPLTGNPRPTLNTEYISTGGNLSLGPSFLFSLPDEENGAKFMGAFSPFLTYRENNKNILVPPAADVSNNFIRKFLNGQPYSIVAGPRRGILSNSKLVGLEYEFTLQDREFIEPFGLNPIVTVRNVGIMIYGNQTAYQRTLSAFNNLHVRDLLITIEAAVEDVLTQYLFEFNDAATRLEIKSIVENFLEGVRNAGGVFDYLVIMDETNNTPVVIDQNFGIIDIALEPARGMQKFINRVTILKTGAIASGGFTIA